MHGHREAGACLFPAVIVQDDPQPGQDEDNITAHIQFFFPVQILISSLIIVVCACDKMWKSSWGMNTFANHCV